VASFLFAKDISSGFLAYKCCVHVRTFMGFLYVEGDVGFRHVFVYVDGGWVLWCVSA